MSNLSRNLSRECTATTLPPIDPETSMSTFFISSNKREPGYFSFLLVEHLVDLHNQLCENILRNELPALLLQRTEEGVKQKELFQMSDLNFFEEMEIEEHSGAYEMRILSVLIEKLSASDVRTPYLVHFNFNQITHKFFNKYFSKVCRVQRSAAAGGETVLPLFIFEGQVSAGNKIGDLKGKLKQTLLTTKQIEELRESIHDEQPQLIFLSRINTLMTFLNGKTKINEEMSLRAYLEALRYQFAEAAESVLRELKVNHIVHVYELFEEVLAEPLMEGIDTAFKTPIMRTSHIESLDQFFIQERKHVGELIKVMSRFCIRFLRDSPVVDGEEKLYGLVLEENADSVDLWGLNNEAKYREMMKVEWEEYLIFSAEEGLGLKHAYDLVKKLR